MSCGFTSHSKERNSSFWRHSSQPISWLSTEKLKQTQQKQTCIRNKIYYNIKLTQKTKARFSRLLRHPAWKWRGSILVLALHKYVTYLLTYTLTHLLTAPGPTQGMSVKNSMNQQQMHLQSTQTRDIPRDMKKWLGYSNLKLSSVNIHSTENEPRSTKSPLKSWYCHQGNTAINHNINVASIRNEDTLWLVILTAFVLQVGPDQGCHRT